ncbi:hypothetical protein [Priestia aryabhattai]|uniref:hypothetical protein n=1 Tax=Priestia aryabhattai TaxID=412384 RepID=UPI002E1D5754|nr:hypothetical protein [Priestia aryabhattai]MED4259672.1 hypothetical protein [Priestia aryabhattai]
MSYYDKKYIKGDPKKYACKEDCKKHEEKEDCKMEHHKYYEEEEKGLLTEFDVDQFPLNPSITSNPNLSANSIAEVKVCVDDCSDRVALDATVEWAPEDITITAELLVLLALVVLLAIPATFRIFRKGAAGTTLISEKTDTSPLLALNLLGVIAVGDLLEFGTITTSIHAVDTNPPIGENTYFLTIDLGPLPSSLPVGFLGFINTNIDITPSNVSSWTFTASEIEAND